LWCDDARQSNVVVQTPDTTCRYKYGGNSLHRRRGPGVIRGYGNPRAHGELAGRWSPRTQFTERLHAENSMVRWLESNGYDEVLGRCRY
jgi:hypothetical protein